MTGDAGPEGAAGAMRIELLRKAVHVGSGFFALALARLGWLEAAAAALAAFAFNAVLLPRIGGRALWREGDRARGFPTGILLYPLVVLALVVLFRRDLAIAAAGWGLLAFGDGFASVVGKSFRGPRLPWNPDKTWSGLAGFLAFGAGAAGLLFGFVRGAWATPAEWGAVAFAALVAGAVESLPAEIDDNVLPPLVGAAALAALLPALAGAPLVLTEAFRVRALQGLALNGTLAAATAGLGLVRPSGALAGLALGTVLFAFGGIGAWALLAIFFALGTAATRFGRARKEALGRAEAAGGRRGAANAFANVAVAAFCVAVAAGRGEVSGAAFRVAAAAAVATALADTTGTEIGQAFRTPTVLLPDFRRVPPGTDGAVSIAGTAAGLAAAALLSVFASATGFIPPGAIGAVVGGSFLGSVVESLLGRDGAPWRVSNGHVLNFLNTLAGAVAGWAIAS